MIRVGIVGVGFMGWIHWLAYKQNPEVSVAAICTPEPERRAGDWTAIQGNFGPPGEHVDLSGIATYENMEELFADANVDLVDICLPPALHVPAICAAAQAGKHVFCEKPLALNAAACDLAVATCQAHQRLLFVGQVLPFFPEYQYAREVIASGAYGKLLGGTFKRVISDPQWLAGFYDPQKIGGPLFDLHVHDAHFIRLLFGMPTGVYSSGRLRDEVVDYCNSIFEFDDPGVTVSSVTGVINQQGRPFTHGFEIHLESATLQFEFAGLAEGSELMPLKLLTSDGSMLVPDLGDGDPVNGFIAEMNEVAQAIQANEASAILSGALARDAIRICEAQAASVKARQFVDIR